MRHAPTQSSLAIGDASKLSSHDQVLRQTKKKMPKSVTRKSIAPGSRAKAANQAEHAI
ncbi:hypothetical protein F2Q69_00037854 [Brassica cretica]|uniref:Uncharacterized protein n=1 Tax=Brassica cretica TaxID=69181 RepID=A0A8S9SJG7_BRACR|nr:hypothetical protein F2Q69_00037854 [Brassica cretica]